MEKGNSSSSVADAIKDFVFDLHDATRRSYRVEDVQQLYDSKFKVSFLHRSAPLLLLNSLQEITEKYLSHAMWPSEEQIAGECDEDQIFLLFYRELTLRHFFAKQKHIQVAPYLESWKTYNKVSLVISIDSHPASLPPRQLFDLLISSPNSFIAITPQWAYDIVQEFVYQFQSFSQYRSQHQHQNNQESNDSGVLLEANKAAWSLPAVTFLLSRAVSLLSNYAPSGSVHYLIGYFSIIELARVQCLVCDYASSFQTAAALTSSTQPSELYTTVFQSHLNLFYHTGIALFMLRRYDEAIALYSSITLHMARLLKPGGGVGNSSNGNNNSSAKAPASFNQFQKVGDKILSLTALAAALSPSTPLDDHVTDLIASKLGDKLRRLKTGDLSSFKEVFESSVPKFVSAIISSSTPITSSDIRHTQTDLFLGDVKQQLDLLPTRRYLRLYSSLPLDKLAHFTDATETQLLSRLLSLSRKSVPSSADGSQPTAAGLNFSVSGSDVVIENVKSAQASGQEIERYFMNGIRKNSELLAETEKIFRRLDA
jgi:translation initiation factor 3 subunit L